MNDKGSNIMKNEGCIFYGEDGLNQMLDEIQKEIDETKVRYFSRDLWITHILVRHNLRTDSYYYLTYDSVTNDMVYDVLQEWKERRPYVESLVIAV